jgi:hypothetical protein
VNTALAYSRPWRFFGRFFSGGLSAGFSLGARSFFFLGFFSVFDFAGFAASAIMYYSLQQL